MLRSGTRATLASRLFRAFRFSAGSGPLARGDNGAMSAWGSVYVASWPLLAGAMLAWGRRSPVAAYWLFWIAITICAAPLLALRLFRACRSAPTEDEELAALS